MTEPYDIHPAPWYRSSWTGRLVSVDGTNNNDFTQEDVVEVIYYGETPKGDWDGDSAGIVRLKDKRIVGWETWWGPTGDGFSCDAYGGDSDIFIGKTVEAVLPYISDRGKELLGL